MAAPIPAASAIVHVSVYGHRTWGAGRVRTSDLRLVLDLVDQRCLDDHDRRHHADHRQ